MKEKKELCEALEELRKNLPPVFAGKKVTEITGGAIYWRHLLNLKAKKEVDDGVFLRNGTRDLMIVRDPFFAWWNNRISKA